MSKMNNSNFPNLVKRHFDFLLATRGFSITSEIYTGFAFSEWIIDLGSENLYIQVSLDKAHVFMDVGMPAKNMKWFDLMSVMMYMTQNQEWKYLWPSGKIDDDYCDKQLAYLSGVIKEHLDEITDEVKGITTDSSRKMQFETFMRIHSK